MKSNTLLRIKRASALITRSLNHYRCYSSSSVDPVLFEYDCGVGRITLNNPSKRNVLTMDVLNKMSENLDQLSKNEELRVLVIKSKGTALSAGHDLKDMIQKDQSYFQSLFSHLTHVGIKLQNLSVPVVAQVNGMAFAAGFQLALNCDMIYATENSSFAVPGIKVGLFCHTPSISLLNSISSPKRAFELLFSGDSITAHEAQQFGLINKVAKDQSDLEFITQEFISKIKQYSKGVCALGKQSFYKQLELRNNNNSNTGSSEVSRVMEGFMVQNAMMKEAQHGFEAFTKKQTPKWDD